MSDDLDPVRGLRPDRHQPDDPNDPAVLANERNRLMSSIDDATARHESEQRNSAIYPRLAYHDEYAALEWLERVFGFQERRESRMGGPPDRMLAWLDFGDGVVMIAAAGPEHHDISSPRDTGGRVTAMINVYVHDIDAHYQRAKTEGARIVTGLEDMFWGDRRYEAFDLEGHRWHFAERLSDIRSPREPRSNYGSD